MNENIDVEKIVDEIEKEPLKKYLALKIIPLILLVGLTALLSALYVDITSTASSAGKGIGLALYLTVFVLIIGIAVSAVSVIVSAFGLAMTLRNYPKGTRAPSVAIFIALIVAQIGIELLFFLLCIL